MKTALKAVLHGCGYGMILITGVTGYIGKETCRLLSEDRVPFRAGVHEQSRRAFPDYVKDVAFIDYHDRDSILKAAAHVDSVLFIPPPNSEMAGMTKTLVEAAAETGISLIVKVSAYGEEDNTLSRLGSWHHEADQVLRASGLSYVILQCMPFMQNFFYIAETMIKKGGVISLPCGDGRVSYIDARDVAASAREILASPKAHSGKRYILTGGEALSYSRIASIMSEATGREVRYRDIDEREAARALEKIGISAPVIEAKIVSFRLERNNQRSYVSPHVKELTGREPFTFPKFVHDHLGYFI